MRAENPPPLAGLPRPAAGARRAVQFGFPVVPLKPRSKEPNVPRGIDDAITSRVGVRARARTHPDDNYGVVLDGMVFVIDVDGPEGEASLRALIGHYGALPPTVETITSRGRHLFFRARSGEPVGSSNGKLGRGIDVKGRRGYVVAADSDHPSGQLYRSAPGRGLGEIEIADASGWLLKLVRRPRWRTDEPSRVVHAKLRASGRRATAYGEAALAAELVTLRGTSEGGRNIALNKAAYALVGLCAAGALDEQKARAQLTETALAVGLTPEQTAKTIDSGMRAGRRSPCDLRHLEDGEAESRPAESVISDPLAAELALLGETDADNAKRFARRQRDAVAYVPGRGLLAYDGQVWRPGGDTLALRLAEDVAHAIAAEAAHLNDPGLQKRRQDWSKQSLSKPALERMVGLARGRLEVPSEAFDAQPWLLNVANGTLDLRTGALRRHDPADRLTRVAAVAFDPEARCPGFRRFLHDSLGGDRETIAYVRRAIGMTLTGDVGQQVLHYLKGGGNTGKSTLANLLRELLGGYACHTPVETFTVKRHEPIPADLARLAGARLVTAGEINWTQQFDEARVKGMTGGDPIAARHLYGHPFEYRPQFKLWLYANEFPKVRATDDAFWRRIRVIPFNITVAPGRIDQSLPAALRAEGPGILNWALAGCRAWRRNGLEPPPAVREATAEWRHGADHVRRYLRERTVTVAGERTSAATLYADFKGWCEEAGEKVLSMAGLKARLVELGPRPEKTRTGRYWVGLRLRG